MLAIGKIQIEKSGKSNGKFFMDRLHQNWQDKGVTTFSNKSCEGRLELNLADVIRGKGGGRYGKAEVTRVRYSLIDRVVNKITDFEFSCEVDLATMPADLRDSQGADLQDSVDGQNQQYIGAVGGQDLS